MATGSNNQFMIIDNDIEQIDKPFCIDVNNGCEEGASGTLIHNNLVGLQGGTTNERYHLTKAQLDSLGGSGSSYTFSNGLVENSGTVQIGGTLSTTTAINLAGNELFLVDTTGTADSSFLGISSQQGFLGHRKYNTDQNTAIYFGLPGHAQGDYAIILRDEVNNRGIINEGDFESNFVPRSLVTKQYVDSGFVTLSTIQTLAASKIIDLSVNLSSNSVAAITFKNSIAATSSVVQSSPASYYQGNSWLSSNNTSVPIIFREFVRPSLGSISVLGSYVIQSSTNNGSSWGDILSISQSGSLVTSSLQAGRQLLTGANNASSGIARGYNQTTDLSPTADNDILVGMDLNSTFSAGQGIGTIKNLVGGTGYTDGFYPGVPLIDNTNPTLSAVATADITVSGGAITVVTIVTRGARHAINNIMTATSSSIGGIGSGFTFQVATNYSYIGVIDYQLRTWGRDVYATDISGQFGALDKISKGFADSHYVDLLTDQTIDGYKVFTNGIQVNKTDVNGTINVQTNNAFIAYSSTTTGSSSQVTINGNSLQGYLNNFSTSLAAAYLSATSSSFQKTSLVVTSETNVFGSAIILRDDIYTKGAVYSTDYSANFENNSLVSKKYVDDAIAAAIAAI